VVDVTPETLDEAVVLVALTLETTELFGVETMPDVVLVELVEVDVLDVLVEVEGANFAVKVSGPNTVATVVDDFWSTKVAFPELETHTEKLKPTLAFAETVNPESALSQFEPVGLVVPALWGETAKAIEYCSA